MSDDSSELKLALHVCSDIREAAEAVLGRVSIKAGEHFKLLMVAKTLRARSLFFGIASLAELNLASPTSALVRCLMELKFVVVSLANNPEWTSDLVEADKSQRGLAMRRLIALPSEHRASNIDPDLMRTALESISATGRGVTVAEWARRANREDEYNLAYMLLSGDVHPSLRGSESHLVLDQQGKPISLKGYPDLAELPFRLMHACDSYLTILSALPEGVVDADGINEIARMYADERKQGINQRALDAVERREFGR